MLLFDLRMHFRHKVLSAAVFNRSQHNFACSTRSVQYCITCRNSLCNLHQITMMSLAFRLFEISRSYDQVGEFLDPDLDGKVRTGHCSVVDWRSSVGGIPGVPQRLGLHAAKINSWKIELTLQMNLYVTILYDLPALLDWNTS